MISKLKKFKVSPVGFLAVYLKKLLCKYMETLSSYRYDKRTKLKDLGGWGVVVGADKALGRAYAVELAKQGLNVVLMGNDFPKLLKLSSLLEKYYQVFAGVVLLFFKADEFKYIEKTLTNLDIAVLVNVIDCADDRVHSKHTLQIPELVALSSTVTRNLTVVTKMCSLVIPKMAFKGKGIIVNVASMALKSSFPYFAVYRASAAYIEKLTDELHHEYSTSGVIIQKLLPDYVFTRTPG